MTKFTFSWFWKLKLQDQSVGHWSILKPLSLACGWPPSLCVLSWPSLWVCAYPNIFFLLEHWEIEFRPSLMTSRHLFKDPIHPIHLFKDPIHPHTHVLKDWVFNGPEKNGFPSLEEYEYTVVYQQFNPTVLSMTGSASVSEPNLIQILSYSRSTRWMHASPSYRGRALCPWEKLWHSLSTCPLSPWALTMVTIRCKPL